MNDFIINYFLIIIICILLFPILIRYLISGSLSGTCASSYNKRLLFRSYKSIMHNILGLSAGLLVTLNIKNNKKMVIIWNLLLPFLILGYLLYNLVKRHIKHSNDFYESSFFANTSDFVFSLIIGLIIGIIINKIYSKYDTKIYIKKPDVFEYHNITIYITLLLSIIWLIIVIYKMINTYGNKC